MNKDFQEMCGCAILILALCLGFAIIYFILKTA